MKGKKRLLTALTVLFITLLFAVPASAKIKTAVLTVKAGNIYYVVDENISGNAIIANQFTVTPQGSAKYDIVYVGKSSDGSIRERCYVNYNKPLTSQAINGYIKSSETANTGALLGIRVRTGTVKISVSSSRNADSFALKPLKSSKSPLAARTVVKGRKVQFQMRAGNTKYIPLIFGGTTGTSIRRPLSSTTYEVYTFLSSALRCVTYRNGVKASTVSYKYMTTFSLSGKKYRSVLIYIPASASSRSSGWLTTTKGYACFQYPRSYLGIAYQLKKA